MQCPEETERIRVIAHARHCRKIVKALRNLKTGLRMPFGSFGTSAGLNLAA